VNEAGAPPEEPVFAAPWQAHAFAMAVKLHERGLFSWREWADELARQIAARPAESYYEQWLAALEALVAAKGAGSAAELERYVRAWDHAADRTPHGRPIELRPEDFSGPPP
jgi:nitrile hydratase accessory protein